jgi:hypothetical protein
VQHGAPVDRDAAQLVVLGAVLDEHGDARIAVQVHDLLRLRERLEHDLAVDDREPERGQVRRSVGADRRHLQALALFDELPELVVAHLDRAALLGHVASSAAHYTIRSAAQGGADGRGQGQRDRRDDDVLERQEQGTHDRRAVDHPARARADHAGGGRAHLEALLRREGGQLGERDLAVEGDEGPVRARGFVRPSTRTR